MSSFDVLAYVPRDATFAVSDMAALRLMNGIALLRDSLVTILRIDLYDDVPEDAAPLNRISCLEASFNEIFNKCRRFLITHWSKVRGRMLVLAGVINRDMGVWESDLYTFVRDEHSGSMPPGAGIVIEMFPLRAWKGMTGVVNEGGLMLPM